MVALDARLQPALVGRVALGVDRDRRHHRDRADRVGADRRLLAQHDGVGAVEDRVGDVGDLGARRARRADHRVEHLRRGDDRPRVGAGRAISFFWTIGTSSIGSSMPRSPRATMMQSATRMISSACSTAWGFSILAISGTRVCSRTVSTSSGRRTKLKATMSTPMRRPASRWAKSSSGTDGSSSAGPGMFRPWREATVPPTSTSASTSQLRHPDRGRPQAHGAVGEVQHFARVDRARQALPADRHPARVAGAVVATALEDDLVADLELDGALDQRADPQLGPGQVLQQRDRAAGAAGGVADELRGLGMLLVRAVAEVQAGDVHARLDHPYERLGVPRGGPDGGDDLRTASHRESTVLGVGADP